VTVHNTFEDAYTIKAGRTSAVRTEVPILNGLACEPAKSILKMKASDPMLIAITSIE